ncbi:MAG: DUF1284 domain-containing protein [Nitrospira sp.]|nr:DUF1284 domain-containing protein [Nitrospira sp.]
MPLLRGHHLICLHFFNGEGYDDAFIKNLADTLRLAEGEDVEISSGADDVCTACLYLKQGKCEQSDSADEDVRAMDAKALKLIGLSTSDMVSWKMIQDKIPRIFHEWYSLYCTDCDWREACEKNSFFIRLV